MKRFINEINDDARNKIGTSISSVDQRVNKSLNRLIKARDGHAEIDYIHEKGNRYE